MHHRWYAMLGIGKLWLALGFGASCIAGIAVTAGWKRLNIGSAMVLLVACGFSLTAFSLSILEVSKIWETGLEWYWQYQRTPSSILTDQSMFAFLMLTLGLAFGGFVVLFAATRLFAWLIGGKSASAISLVRISRTKILIGLAVVLFIAKVAQDVIFPMGVLHGLQSVRLDRGVGTAGVIIVLGFVLLLLLPSLCLVSQAARRWKVLLVLVVAALSITGVIVRISMIQPRLDVRVLTCVFASLEMVFLWTVASVAKQVGPTPSISSISVRRYPSIWAIVPVAIVCASGFIVYWFDVSTLVNSRGEDWPSARLAKVIRRDSNGQVGLIKGVGICAVVANLTEDVPADVFAPIAGSPISGLNLSGLQADTDTSMLKGATHVWLTNCRITSARLKALTTTATDVMLRDVEVLDPDGTVNIVAGSTLNIHVADYDHLESVLRSFGNVSSYLTTIGFDRAPQVEELDAILAFSQRFPVYVDGCVVEAMVNLDYKPSLSAVNVFMRFNQRYVTKESMNWADPRSNISRYFLESDIFMCFDDDPDDDWFWDRAFAKNKQARTEFSNRIPDDSFADEPTLRKYATEFHWDFSPDSESAITHLFLPNAESVLTSSPSNFDLLKHVETLSLDPYWLSRDDPLSKVRRARGWLPRSSNVDYGGLEKLTNLKRLDLCEYNLVVDASLLTRIPKIEHLQIGLSQTTKPMVDFGVCKQLKTLVYFGTPTRNNMKSLGSLKQLASVTIVTSASDMLWESEIKKIRAAIPGVQLNVVDTADFLPSVPESFTRHVKECAAKIRQELGVQSNKPQ